MSSLLSLPVCVSDAPPMRAMLVWPYYVSPLLDTAVVYRAASFHGVCDVCTAVSSAQTCRHLLCAAGHSISAFPVRMWA